MVSRQAVQARLADSAIWLYAWACTLSKLDRDIRRHEATGNGSPTSPYQRDRRRRDVFHWTWPRTRSTGVFAHLFHDSDDAMLAAADAALAHTHALPNDRYVIPESSPVAKGTGRNLNQDGIKQFPGKAGH